MNLYPDTGRRTDMIIGYARVSTFDQNLDRQIYALTKYGCEKIIKEKCTGTTRERRPRKII